MYDALVISDIHLGSDNCQARALVELLDRIRRNDLATRRLILNGDVFDSIDFRRLNKHHWKVLSTLRKLSDEVEIIWINGNHDGPAEFVSHLLGVAVRDEIVLESGDRKVLLLHGHRFDDFIERYPLTSLAADGLYRLLQRIDRSHTIARRAKHRSKLFLRCVEKVADGAIDHAARQGCQVVCCGHTHVASARIEPPVEYYNSGCWTERTCHFLAIRAGRVELHPFTTDSIVEVDPG